VFAGGINKDVALLMVVADGTVTSQTYPQTREFDGGFCVLELPSREAALQWAAKSQPDSDKAVLSPSAFPCHALRIRKTSNLRWKDRLPARTSTCGQLS